MTSSSVYEGVEVSHPELSYRRLFETAQDGILILDAVTGKILDVNPFMEELLGRSRTDFLDKELWQIGLFARRPLVRRRDADDRAHTDTDDPTVGGRDGGIIPTGVAARNGR